MNLMRPAKIKKPSPPYERGRRLERSRINEKIYNNKSQ